MSIASEITRLQTSKADIKTQVNIDVDDINEGTDFIGSETVNDYDEKIQEMQEAYKAFIPVSTTSDTQIDAPKGGAIIGKTLKGNTSQSGTPTPSTPIPVNNVTGEQIVTISNGTDSKDYEVNLGANLLDIQSSWVNNKSQTSNGLRYILNEDDTISISGTSTNYSSVYARNYNSTDVFMTLKANHKYRLLVEISNKTSTINSRVFFGTTSANIGDFSLASIGGNGTYYKDYTPTQDVGLTQYSIIGAQGAGEISFIMKIAIYDITTNVINKYIKYFTPIELNKIGNYQDFIRKGTGKNLFDKDTITTGKYITDIGGEGTNNTTFYSDYIKVQPNTKYYVSGRNNGWGSEAFYDENKTFISRPNEANNIFTTTSTTYYIRVNGHLNDVNNLQMEQGTTATSYEPYGYKDKWYIEKNTLKLVVPNAVTGTMQNSNKRFYVNGIELGTRNILKNTQSSKTYGLYCDILEEKTAGQTWSGTQGISYDYNSGMNLGCIDFAINGLTTIAEYQNALKGKAIYAIANTPEYTLIENEDLIEQLEEIIPLLEGQNNISVDGSIPVYMDLDYIVKADRYLIGNRREGK